MNNPAMIYQSRADLAEWRARQIESRILEEIYEPMWYHYNASLSDHEDIAVYVVDQETRIEVLDSTVEFDGSDGKRGVMSQMLAGFWANHEYYRIGIKQREPGDTYRIGIDCPNQWGEHGSIYNALIQSNAYTDIVGAVDQLVELTLKIIGADTEPQWLTIPKKGGTQ